MLQPALTTMACRCMADTGRDLITQADLVVHNRCTEYKRARATCAPVFDMNCITGPLRYMG